MIMALFLPVFLPPFLPGFALHGWWTFRGTPLAVRERDYRNVAPILHRAAVKQFFNSVRSCRFMMASLSEAVNSLFGATLINARREDYVGVK